MGTCLNGYAESFFSRLPDELLNCEDFADLAEARWFAKHRKEKHNQERPHSSLDYQTPSESAAGCAAASATPRLQPRHSRISAQETSTITRTVLS